MRHFIMLCLCLFLCAGLTACNSKDNVKTETEIPIASDSEVEYSDTESKSTDKISDASADTDIDTENESKKESQAGVLIAYFSRVGNTDFPEGVDAVTTASLVVKNDTMYGNTQYLATLIQQATGGDLFSVQVEEKYPSDYDATVDRAQIENNDNVHPKLSSHVDNMEDYQVIFLGYPNWWYDMPMPIYSFLDEYDLSGKTIIPFCTSGGSEFSKSISEIQSMEPNATIITDGFAISDSKIEDCTFEEVDGWIKKLDITFKE